MDKEERQEKEIMELELKLRKFIGETALMGDTKVCLRGLTIPAIERLPELYEAYKSGELKKRQGNNFSPEAIMHKLQEEKIETTAWANARVLSDKYKGVYRCSCGYHAISMPYEEAIDPKARLSLCMGHLDIAGSRVNIVGDMDNLGGDGRIQRLKVDISLPVNITLFAEGGLFYSDRNRPSITKGKIQSLEETTKSLSDATSYLTAVNNIASRYGATLSMYLIEGTCYDGFLRRNTKVCGKLEMSVKLDSDESILQFGNAVVELGKLDQLKYGCQWTIGANKSLEQARLGTSQICKAKPRFERYHELMQAYIKENAPFW